MSKKDLTIRQLDFCIEYAKSGNATDAALKANYAVKGAGQTAAHLLKNPKIQAEIHKRKARQGERSEMDAKFILDKIKAIQDLDIAEWLDVEKASVTKDQLEAMPKELRRLIKKIHKSIAKDGSLIVNIEFMDKEKMLEHLSRHLSFFNDKVDVKVEGEVKTFFDYMSSIDLDKEEK